MIDGNELADLAADLGRVGPAAVKNIMKAGDFAATELRDIVREKAPGGAMTPAYPASITWDRDPLAGFGVAAWEVGPDKDRPQGALGNLLEYGSRNNAPIPHLGPAAVKYGPKWADDVEKFARQSLEDEVT